MKYLKMAKDIAIGIVSIAATSFVLGIVLAGLVKLFLLGWNVWQ